LTNREHIIALEPLDNGLMGRLLRYPYEVRDEEEYFDDIQDVKVTKDMLDLAKHIVIQKASDFEPEKFEDHYEEALTELINAKLNGKTVGSKPRPRGENVVGLMDALKRSIARAAPAKGKKPRKASSGQKEMLLPLEGKKPAAKKAAKARSFGRAAEGWLVVPPVSKRFGTHSLQNGDSTYFGTTGSQIHRWLIAQRLEPQPAPPR
jgi:DNA end-binding protein Ku